MKMSIQLDFPFAFGWNPVESFQVSSKAAEKPFKRSCLPKRPCVFLLQTEGTSNHTLDFLVGYLRWQDRSVGQSCLVNLVWKTINGVFWIFLASSSLQVEVDE